MTRGLKISVAICTWNRCELLANALDRLAGGAQPPRVPWEVLVVNNACSDDTSTVVASFAERLPIQEMFEPEPGLSHARNRALHESTGTHVAFIDDDVFVEEGWLVAFADLAGRYPEAAVFAGPVQAYFPVTPDPDVVAAFPYLRRGFCGLDHEQSEGPLPGGLLPAGANMAFRKAALDGLRFEARLGAKRDEGYGHEDVEFVRRGAGPWRFCRVVAAVSGTALRRPRAYEPSLSRQIRTRQGPLAYPGVPAALRTEYLRRSPPGACRLCGGAYGLRLLATAPGPPTQAGVDGEIAALHGEGPGIPG